MFLLLIGNKQLRSIMSEFLDNARKLLERVAQGNGNDPQVKADVEELKTLVTANSAADAENKASDEEVKTLLNEILEKLASAPPADPNA
jgi:hypothetical protein